MDVALGIIADSAISGMKLARVSSMSPTKVDFSSAVMVLSPTFSVLKPLFSWVLRGSQFPC